jgi:hypothetical protein
MDQTLARNQIFLRLVAPVLDDERAAALPPSENDPKKVHGLSNDVRL